ncbi:MAG: hypothetical protein U0105_13415 [Candidatus Obscuribacterales bacterium]
MTVVDFDGAISSLELPEGWCEGFVRTPYHGSAVRTFSPPGKEDEFALNLWSRGTALTERSEIKFAAILSQPAHELGPHEIESLSEVLANMGKESMFTISRARTTDINGKRVLLVGGQWTSLNKTSVGMFVPLENYSKVDEIYCLCQPDAYEQYAPVLDEVFASLRWQA